MIEDAALPQFQRLIQSAQRLEIPCSCVIFKINIPRPVSSPRFYRGHRDDLSAGITAWNAMALPPSKAQLKGLCQAWRALCPALESEGLLWEAGDFGGSFGYGFGAGANTLQIALRRPNTPEAKDWAWTLAPAFAMACDQVGIAQATLNAEALAAANGPEHGRNPLTVPEIIKKALAARVESAALGGLIDQKRSAPEEPVAPARARSRL